MTTGQRGPGPVRTVLVAAVLALGGMAPAPAADAQERPTRWQRRAAPTEAPITVFHSTQAANLPTAETLRGGEWLFEISHRFLPAVSEGADALWGFDGPVYNRLGLAYAATDRVMIGVLRTNLDDNLEFNVKARLAEGGRASVPWMVAVAGGVAVNTEAPVGAEDNEAQAYAQLLVNALFGGRLAVGAAPTLLRNPVLRSTAVETDFALGLHGQLYASEQVSFLAEWIMTPEHDPAADLEHDGATFGIELETGGHFFKILLTNQVRMNPTQFLAGAAAPVAMDEWRVGFNITRLLSF